MSFGPWFLHRYRFYDCRQMRSAPTVFLPIDRDGFIRAPPSLLLHRWRARKIVVDRLLLCHLPSPSRLFFPRLCVKTVIDRTRRTLFIIIYSTDEPTFPSQLRIRTCVVPFRHDRLHYLFSFFRAKNRGDNRDRVRSFFACRCSMRQLF